MFGAEQEATLIGAQAKHQLYLLSVDTVSKRILVAGNQSIQFV